MLTLLTRARPEEMRAVAASFACNFVLMASYYLLRPVRDAMATVFGVDHLQFLFTGTLALTLVVSPVFASPRSSVASRSPTPPVTSTRPTTALVP